MRCDVDSLLRSVPSTPRCHKRWRGMRLAADLCVCIGAKDEKMIDKSILVCYNK